MINCPLPFLRSEKSPWRHAAVGTLPVPVDALPASLRAAVPLIERLVGKLQHIAVHPGGIVIAEPSIVRYAPLERAPKGVLVTQYDMHSLAQLGLVTTDFTPKPALAEWDKTFGRPLRP